MYKPMRFWGTGAAGAIPTPFCKCEVCENARRVGGKEVRFRSAFRMNEKVMIDIGAAGRQISVLCFGYWLLF